MQHSEESPVRLDRYTQGEYTPGAPMWQQVAWYFVGSPLVRSYWLPFSGVKVWLLRRFGAQIGRDVRIKPGVRVKFPWRLRVGDRSWIGEGVWLDNLAEIAIAARVCISQGAYLCTGNHRWDRSDFALETAAIALEEGCWVAAKAAIAPGVTVGRGAVLSLGSVATQSLAPMTIYAGNPARPIKPRLLSPDE